jgi:hypothetical protein
MAAMAHAHDHFDELLARWGARDIDGLPALERVRT